MESIAVWQGATLGGIVAWILISSYLNVTRKLRSFLQPWVAHHVIAGTPLIFQIQVLFNFCNYKRKPRSSFLFKCLYIYVFLLFIGVNFFFLGFFFFFQKYQHWFFDALFSGLSCVVSVPFYTAFLPLLFWVCSVSL